MVNEDLLPNLKTDGYEITSAPTEEYNCIAWAAGFIDVWIDPNAFWPDDVPQEDTVENIIEVYKRHGFELCTNPDFTLDYEKIAIYGREGIYLHAAKLLNNGHWSSKLGPDEDITHPKLESIAGDFYGQVVAFMQRKIVHEETKV